MIATSVENPDIWHVIATMVEEEEEAAEAVVDSAEVVFELSIIQVCLKFRIFGKGIFLIENFYGWVG